jgi:uncharacterized RDD family membrane protein YckC
MNCPECNKIVNSGSSACSACGLIVDENVRLELGIDRLFAPDKNVISHSFVSRPQGNIVVSQPNNNSQSNRSHTSEIGSKETSPTLLGFPNKNMDLPEWRLKLQEAVKTRKEVQTASLPKPIVTRRRAATTRGSNALAIDVIERVQPRVSSNPLLDLAIQRIERSRRMYAVAESTKVIEQKVLQPISSPVQNRVPLQFVSPKVANAHQNGTNFEISKSSETIAQSEVKVPRMIRVEESELVENANLPATMKPKIERIKTNKLPPLVPARVSSSLGRIISNGVVIEEIKIKEETVLEEPTIFAESLENDDIPPFAMRVNSAIFDLIIGAFLSVILLSPLVLLGSNLFSVSGLFGFLGVFSVVMFAYLTISIGMLGKTLGMRLFSLEVINAEDDDFPSFNQSAISSSVYLLSLALGGIGFLAMFFNDDRRAAHDLLSGTIVVREL